MKRIVWFVLFLIIGVSCLDQPDCFRQDVNLIGITFRKMIDGRTDTLKSVLVFADGTQIIDGKDIAFGDTTTSRTSIVLPLNYLNKDNITTYTIITRTTNGDTRSYVLRLGYKSQAQFVSVDCGQRFIVSDLTIPDYQPGAPPLGIDSIRMVSNTPSNNGQNNIEIFRCPRYNVTRLSFRQLFMDADSLGKPDSRRISAITSDYEIKPVVDSVSGLTSAALLTLNPQSTQTNFKFSFNSDNKVITDTSIAFVYKVESAKFNNCTVPQVSEFDTIKNDFKHLKIATRVMHDPPYTNTIIYRCATTNTIRVNFKQQLGSLTPAKAITLNRVLVDGKKLLRDSTVAVSSLVLPLNSSANSTTFTFVTGQDTSTLQLNYTTQQFTYQKVCGVQTKFSALQINTQNTTYKGATITSPDVKFPTTDNVQILLQ